MYKNLLPEANSQTTLELRELVEGGMCLFDPVNKYPIWDEKHRKELEQKIVDHYYMRQIAFETPGRFKFELNVRMREIMPRFNKIWKTTQYEYNPIENYNMLEGSTDESKGSGTSKAEGLEKVSDTPMSSVSNLDKHMTSASQNESNAETSSNSKTEHSAFRHGNIGVTSTQQLIQQERDATIDVDMMIIDALKDLFLGVY